MSKTIKTILMVILCISVFNTLLIRDLYRRQAEMEYIYNFRERFEKLEDIVFKSVDAIVAASDAIQAFAAKLIQLYAKVYELEQRLNATASIVLEYIP